MDDHPLADGDQPALTRKSVEHEVAWWENATVMQKLLRRVREIINYL